MKTNLPGDSTRSEVGERVTGMERGEVRTAEELLPLIYAELRRLAAQKLSREKPGQTLQATALVHEAWLRLAGVEQKGSEPKWDGRRHFFGAAAEAMRRILIENARRKARVRHGGSCDRVNFDEIEIASPLPDDDLLALNEGLDRLAELDGPAAELVKLRFFTGLTHQQAADLLGLSRSAADRTWLFARAWLYEQMRPREP
jgi:RNA polymerase sigma factor (TIGR02999 family)